MASSGNLRTIADYYTRHITPLEAEFMQRFFLLRRSSLLSLLFRTASRLGDGGLWVSCALLLGGFGGREERLAVAAGLLAVAASVALFMAIKNLIGLSRVFLGLHYPTDVLVGALLGTTLGRLASRAVLEWAA